MWQTVYYIIGSAGTVALTLYGIVALHREKRKKDFVQCEECSLCMEVDAFGDIRCSKRGIFQYRPKYCGDFSPKGEKVESS